MTHENKTQNKRGDFWQVFRFW